MTTTIGNNLQVRKINKCRIVNLLYTNNLITKQEISNILNLSLPTVALILKELMRRGLVIETNSTESSGGRKPLLYSLIYDAKYSAGIEITKNHVKFSLINLAGKTLCFRRLRKAFEDSNTYWMEVAGLLQNLIAEMHVTEDKLLGVGIALPGIVRADENLLEYAPTLGVKHVHLDHLKKYFRVPVLINNEANLAGFAETWGMEQIKDAVFLSINKGVGGAIIINNNVYNGNNSRSGEFGHMTIIRNGAMCSCGQRGCLEAYCSTNVLLGDRFLNLDEFFSALPSEPELQAKWETYLDDLATAINNIRTIFDTDVIIGGEIGCYIQKNMNKLTQRLKDLNIFGDDEPYLHISKYDNQASSVGAALLFVDQFINS